MVRPPGGRAATFATTGCDGEGGTEVEGQVFIAPGDLTQIAAHAVAYSTDTHLASYGDMYPSFSCQVAGFAAWFAELGRLLDAECRVGDTFWMPLSDGAPPHGMVVVAATSGSAAAEDEAAAAVRGALDEAVHRLRGELGLRERLLIALPTFRLGQGGDRDRLLRSARAQVAAAREALARHPGVDAAFIAYTPAIYRIFLEARRQTLGGPPSGPEPDPALVRALRDGECVLFVGAGLSSGAGLPGWGELVAQLARELGLPAADGADNQADRSLDLAQWYRERFGPEALAEVVRDTFGGRNRAPRPTLAHYLLMSLSARHVITTNYDDLLERALTALKKYPVKVVRQEDAARTGRTDGVCVVKLHGDAVEPGEIILCRDDYDEFFERRPALALLLEGLLLNRTFFFVGYGLRDPNFRQVYGRVGRMLQAARRPAFATSFESGGEAGSYLGHQWSKKNLGLIGIAGAGLDEQKHHLLRFLDRLADRVASGDPGLLLAPDAEVPDSQTEIRRLLQRVGGELIGLFYEQPGSLAGKDVPALAAVLGLLAAQGWRPLRGSRIGLCGLWERLALHAPDDASRQRLLIAALEVAEGHDEARRIRDRLDAVEVPPMENAGSSVPAGVDTP